MKRISIFIFALAPALYGCKKEEASTSPDEAAAEPEEEEPNWDDTSEGEPTDFEGSEPETLTATNFEEVVNTNMQDVVDCYTEAVGKNAKLQGTMQARFTIGGEGQVEKVEAADGSSLSDAGLTACIENKAKGWSFLKTANGESMPMEFPFNLAPG
jgi:hypothetical protein